MPPQRSSRKPDNGAAGLKVLITSASLAATLAGWAALALQQSKSGTVVPTVMASATVVTIPTPQPLSAMNLPTPEAQVMLPALPTLVPPPAINTPAAHVVVAAYANSANAAGASSPAPVNQAPPQPTLRFVSAPQPPPPPPPPASSGSHPQPQPVATTKSSQPH